MDTVTICNMALSAIGTQSTIASLNENSTEAQYCSINYAATRDELLRKYRWGFTRAQVTLALFAAAAGTPENANSVAPFPPTPWLYEYLYPNDCLRAWKILPFTDTVVSTNPPLTTVPAGTPPIVGGPPVRFEIGQDVDAKNNPIRVILTNQEQAQLVYCRETTNENLFDAAFVTALVGRLAAKLVMPLSGDKALAKLAIDAGQKVEQDAASEDANEGLIIQERPADWISARGAGRDWVDGGYYASPAGVFGPSYPID